MKLDVPFFKQTTSLNCGPYALKMVFAYFDEDPKIETLENKTEIKEGKGVSTIQIATAAALSGYKVDFYSRHISFNEENMKLDYYRKYSDDIQRSAKLIEEAKKAGVKMYEKEISLEKILEKIGKKCIPIVLLDWNSIKGQNEKGYQGHFVPIVGYNKNYVIVHNHGFDNPTPYFKMKKDIFEKARKSKGTDEDIIFISK